MPEILVTGATGFLGRHLCSTLVEWGAGVTALVRRAPRGPSAALPEGVGVTVADLSNPRGRVLPKDVDYVFHLAARTSPHASAGDPLGVFELNALSTARLLEEVRTREMGLSRFVLASTSLVYAPSAGRRLAEGGPTRPASPYAGSKAAAEAHALACDAVYDIPVSVIRVFNAYGPGQAPGFLVPSVLRQCVAGGDVRLGNLWPIRDFVYAGDVADLFWSAARSPRGRGEVFNAGTGRGTSVGDLARLCKRLTGNRGRIRSEKKRARKQDVRFLVADTKKSRDLLAWEPQTSLAEGIDLTAATFRDGGA